MVLANFKFGNLNALHHIRVCINYYWQIFNLAIFQKFTKTKNLTKVSRYTVLQKLLCSIMGNSLQVNVARLFLPGMWTCVHHVGEFMAAYIVQTHHTFILVMSFTTPVCQSP